VADRFGRYLVAVLMAWVAMIVASVIGSVACGLGVAWTSLWAYLVQAHLMAQVQPAGAMAEPAAAL